MAWRWRRTSLGGEADRAAFRALHNASLASPALREGLTTASAERSVRHLRALLGTPAAGLGDTSGLLAWDGLGGHHRSQLAATISQVAETGRTMIVDERTLVCEDGGCEVRQAIVSPLVVEDTLVGALVVGAPHTTGGLVRAADEVASWVSGQLELAELDASRTRLMEAEVRALRAQISPHFIYNSLGAIASFVRTDPDRARELLLEFADFTRYSFRRHGDYTTLAEELRSVERYLLLEQARFGDRLQVTLQIAASRPAPTRRTASATSRSPRATSTRSACWRSRTTAPARTPSASARRWPATRRWTRSASATSTPGCATPTATTTVWWSRPHPAPARR
jgi:two-component system LytT family sensor kinase